jgi:hypothetical protein
MPEAGDCLTPEVKQDIAIVAQKMCQEPWKKMAEVAMVKLW